MSLFLPSVSPVFTFPETSASPEITDIFAESNMAYVDDEKRTIGVDPVDERKRATGVHPEGGNSFDEITATSDRDLDDTYQIYKATEDLEATESEVKRVLRKIDLRIVTILFVTYMLQYLDKNSLNFASVYGLQTATGLVGQQFQWLGRPAMTVQYTTLGSKKG
jgi:hypothetical protein